MSSWDLAFDTVPTMMTRRIAEAQDSFAQLSSCGP